MKRLVYLLILLKWDIANYNEFVFPKIEQNDIACLKNIVHNGNDISISYSIPYSLLANESKLNNDICVCDFVAFPGYPNWYDRLNNLPILRTGSIASDPRFDYSVSSNFMGNCIAYEAFSFGGSSGSPVFAIQKGFKVGSGLTAYDGFYREILLIGINAGHFPDPEGHSGISYFYKSSAIIELIDSL